MFNLLWVVLATILIVGITGLVAIYYTRRDLFKKLTAIVAAVILLITGWIVFPIPIPTAGEETIKIYAGADGATIEQINEWWHSNGTLIKHLDTSYPTYGLAVYGDYVYYGLNTDKVYQAWRSNFTTRLSYSGYTNARQLIVNDTFLWIGGIAGYVHKLWVSNMTKQCQTSTSYGYITSMYNDTDYLYVSGSNNNYIFKYSLSTLSLVLAGSTGYGAYIMGITGDDTFLYYGGQNTYKIWKVWKSNLTKQSESDVVDSGSAHIDDLVGDGTYVYLVDRVGRKVKQYWMSNLTKKQESTYLLQAGGLKYHDGFIYVGGNSRLRSHWVTNMTEKINVSTYSSPNVNITSHSIDVYYETGWSNSPPANVIWQYTDGAAQVPLTPTLKINVSDPNIANQTINTTWQFYDTDHWYTFGYNETLTNITGLQQVLSNATAYNTEYTWRVVTHDNFTIPAWDNDSQSFTTVFNYTAQTPPPSSEWDSVYEDNILINYMYINFSSLNSTYGPASSYPMYSPRLTDRSGGSRIDTNLLSVSDSTPWKLYCDLPNASNISWFRFYYWHEYGLDWCPAKYSVYNGSTFVQEFNQTASVNGQWVRCNLTSPIIACSNFTLYVNMTRTEGGSTRVSLAELQLFNNVTNPFFAKEQKDVIYFEEIPQYWNGLQWATTLRMDDVSNGATIAQYLVNLMPVTIGSYEGLTGDNDSWTYDKLDSTWGYHVEWASHFTVNMSTEPPAWVALNYTWGRNLSEEIRLSTWGLVADTAHISKWSDDGALTHHYQSSRSTAPAAKGAFDYGLRAGSSDSMDVVNWVNTSTLVQNKTRAGWSFYFGPPGNFSNYNVQYPVNAWDMMRISKWGATTGDSGVCNHYIHTWDFFNKTKDNGSYFIAYIHPQDEATYDGLSWEYQSYVENDTVGWHCLEGEISSYIINRAYTNITYNSTGSNSTHIVYDINRWYDDPYTWEVPLTFKFNRTFLNLTNGITTRWQGNDTLYNNSLRNCSTFTAIPGSDTGFAQHINQTMREGYRISGDYVYVSILPDNKSIVFNWNLSTPVINLITPTNGSTTYTSPIVSIWANNSDLTSVNVSWYEAVDNIKYREVVYTGGATTNKLYQYACSNLTKVGETASYGGTIYAVAQDEQYIYLGGSIDTVWQCWKTNLTKKLETATYGGDVRALAIDDTYVYAAGATTQKVFQYWKSNMTKKAETTDFGGSILAILQDDTYIYTAGSTTQKVFQFWKSNMTKKTETIDYGGTVYAIAQDDTYIYAGGYTIFKVFQFWKSNMTKKAETTSQGNNIYAVGVDDLYVYAAGYVGQIFRYWKSNLTTKDSSADYGGSVYCIDATDELYVYIAGSATKKVFQHWKSNLTKKAETADYGGNIFCVLYNIYTDDLILSQTNVSVSANSIVRWTYTNATYENAIYYYLIKVESENNSACFSEDWFWFTTTGYTPPSLSSPAPANQSVGVTKYPTLNITVNDADGNTSTVCFWENHSSPPTWVKIQQNDTFPAGNVARVMNFTLADTANTKYWWKVTAEDEQGNTSAIYHFTTITAPTIIVNFAGNLSDAGGPYWRPPGQSTPLTGIWSDGYYTNNSKQKENWMYINCTITSGETVWLNWLNESTWTNWTYSLSNTVGNYWDINTSGVVLVCDGYNYSFDIFANNTEGNTRFCWNKTGMLGNVVRRYVGLSYETDSIEYAPYYFQQAVGETQFAAEDDMLHDQGVFFYNDTSGVVATTPSDSFKIIRCASFVAVFFNESVCISDSWAMTNIYYHFWWAANSTAGKIFWNRTRTYAPTLAGIDTLNISAGGAASNIQVNNGFPTYSNNYYLNTGLLDITDETYNDNDIYEFYFGFGNITQSPSIICNRSYTSFIIFNIPDDTTLNSTDWSGIGGGIGDYDGDARSDWNELYVDFTNPFLDDTDNDGADDYAEYLSGSDPNNYTDTAESTSTSVNTISPYSQSSTPLAITATGSSGLTKVALWYRWSPNNVTWATILADWTNDTIDSNTCDVDSSPDKGTESNFINAQDLKDDDYMTIEEEDTTVVHNDAVDGNTTDKDGSGDIGIETGFANCQGTSPDASSMNIQESDTGVGSDYKDPSDSNTADKDISADVGVETGYTNSQSTSPDASSMVLWEGNVGSSGVDEWLYVDGPQTTETGWSPVGTAPYLSTQNQPTDYIYSASNGAITSNWYTFANTTGEGDSFTVNLSIYWRANTGDSYPQWDIDTNGDGVADESGSFSTTTVWGWATVSTSLTTHIEINAARVRFILNKGAGGPEQVNIDCARLGVYMEGSTNYNSDFEYQFNSCNYSETNEQLCFYLQNTPGESLNVSYWTGTGWAKLGTISSSGWTNMTATLLQNSTYNIRLNDTTISSDTTNSTWQIDCMFLHVWSAAAANYKIDFEYNWSSANYSDTTEQLCIYVAARTGTETLNISYWTGTGWAKLGDITSTGWANVTATLLQNSTYTIRFNGTSETSDSEQGDWDIDCMFLHTHNASNYEIDFEYQWTAAIYNKQYENISIYVTAHPTGSETLNVNFWNGSWETLGPITATGWNNFTGVWLVSSTFTLQFIGAIETGDTTQDSWQIDCIYLQTHNLSAEGWNWSLWIDASNPDSTYPWAWNFNFPNSTGYYEFYSIGNLTGYANESAPSSKDAMCYYEYSAVTYYEATVRNMSVDYFTWLGSNVSAWHVAQAFSGFDGADESISIWIATVWDPANGCWVKYNGTGTGTNWTIHTFDVVRVLLNNGAGTQIINMTGNSAINYANTRNITLVNTTNNKGYNYTGFSNTTATSLEAIATELSLPTGYWVAKWNQTTYNWTAYIVGSGMFNDTVERWDVIETKVNTLYYWEL